MLFRNYDSRGYANIHIRDTASRSDELCAIIIRRDGTFAFAAHSCATARAAS